VALFAYRTAVQETTTISPFEVLYNRVPRLPGDLDLVRIENKIVKEFDKNWLLAKEKVREAGEKSKEFLKRKYDEKIINIGDNVRMLSLPTKTGLKIKLRGDLWTGPFKVIGKLANGDLKLNIYKRGAVNRKKPYITHPDRLKLAEKEYLPISLEHKKKILLKKSVRFEEKVVTHTAKTFLVKTHMRSIRLV
jgi:hypothetical protein